MAAHGPAHAGAVDEGGRAAPVRGLGAAGGVGGGAEGRSVRSEDAGAAAEGWGGVMGWELCEGDDGGRGKVPVVGSWELGVGSAREGGSIV